MKHLIKMIGTDTRLKVASSKVDVSEAFRSNVLYLCHEIGGFPARLPLRAWAEIKGIARGTIYDRVHKGKSPERCLDPRVHKSTGRPAIRNHT